MYLYVPFVGDDEETLKDLPAALLNLTGQLSRVMELELTPQRKLARADVLDVMAALQSNGYYLQMSPNDLLKSDTAMLRDDSDTF